RTCVQNQNAGKAMNEQTNTPEDATIPDLQEKVLQALKTVYDPEIPVDVYELGLIYEISVYSVNNVYVLMTLTSPAGPSAEVIPEENEKKLRSNPGINEVKVDGTFDPPYAQDMMSKSANMELGFMYPGDKQVIKARQYG